MKHRQANNGVIAGNGINGSLRKRETTQPQQNTEYYLFNSQGNLKAYSDDVMSFAYYGYNAANTRTYKLSLYNTNLWINGQQQPLNMQLQQAMFYPNTYLNFNQNGEYTKHYYNGTERIASRLGDNTITIAINNNILEDRKLQLEEQVRNEIQELISETPQVDMPPMLDILNLQPTGTPNDIYYYHPNHLGSTSFVTDNNTTITQGFLYAPFGEITTEYNINFGNNVIPKYSFNAKELDEETGMYYYEARYYKPPVFTSRDPMFEKYFWMSPYAYCANNPVKYVDPDGREPIDPRTGKQVKIKFYNAAVYEYNDDINMRKSFDKTLYKHNINNITWKESNRMRSKPDGIWEGADPFPLKKSLQQIDYASKQLLESFFPNKENVTSTYVQGKCYNWQKVAKIGNYSYVDDIYSRGRKHFNIISVKDNIVNQIIHFEKKEGLFRIESVTSFETQIIGNTIIVNESVQQYRNGHPYEKPKTKKYETILEN